MMKNVPLEFSVMKKSFNIHIKGIILKHLLNNTKWFVVLHIVLHILCKKNKNQKSFVPFILNHCPLISCHWCYQRNNLWKKLWKGNISKFKFKIWSGSLNVHMVIFYLSIHFPICSSYGRRDVGAYPSVSGLWQGNTMGE